MVFSPQLENDGNRIFVFFTTVLVVYLAVDVLKIMLAKSLNRHLTPFRIFWLKRIIAIIMGICGAVLIFKGVFPDTSEQFEKELHIMPEIEPVDPSLEGLDGINRESSLDAGLDPDKG